MVVSSEEVIEWSFNYITLPQFEETRTHVAQDTSQRKEYLDSAFRQVIMDLQIEIGELQSKVLLVDTKVQEKISKSRVVSMNLS